MAGASKETTELTGSSEDSGGILSTLGVLSAPLTMKTKVWRTRVDLAIEIVTSRMLPFHHSEENSGAGK